MAISLEQVGISRLLCSFATISRKGAFYKKHLTLTLRSFPVSMFLKDKNMKVRGNIAVLPRLYFAGYKVRPFCYKTSDGIITFIYRNCFPDNSAACWTISIVLSRLIFHRASSNKRFNYVEHWVPYFHRNFTSFTATWLIGKTVNLCFSEIIWNASAKFSQIVFWRNRIR